MPNVLMVFFRGLNLFIQVLFYALIIQAFLSWVMPPFHPIRKFLMRITDPLCRPFRRLTDKLIEKGLPLDLSPLFACIALQLISRLLVYVQWWIMY